MSAQLLSARSLRRIARRTGIENLKWAVGHGGYVFVLCTRDHRHYEYDKKTGEAHEIQLRFHYWICQGRPGDDGDWDGGVIDDKP